MKTALLLAAASLTLTSCLAVTARDLRDIHDIGGPRVICAAADNSAHCACHQKCVAGESDCHCTGG